jgi:UDP-N-acetylglucosamine--N-acetylmuramyl-(pentapeptide) pyrophosphoryl-undecaprenol N-acetylglucosamine transferase
VLVQQNELTPQYLADLLAAFTREQLLEMAIHARQLAKPESTRLVAEACMEMMK